MRRRTVCEHHRDHLGRGAADGQRVVAVDEALTKVHAAVLVERAADALCVFQRARTPLG